MHDVDTSTKDLGIVPSLVRWTNKMRAVFTVPTCRRLVDHGAETCQRRLASRAVRPVEHDLHNQVHFAQAHDKSREQVDAKLVVTPPRNLDESCRICAADGTHRREGDVCSVRYPLNPSQFLDVGCPGSDAVARPEVLVRWQRGWVNTPGASHFLELGVDDVQLVLSYVWRPVRHAIIHPGVVTQRDFGRRVVDHIDWNRAISRVIRASRISEDRDALDDVTQLRNIFENVTNPQRADDFNLYAPSDCLGF